tara:strand:+ start:493 stop:768 length:276 start_codon:yes stop_codon:yes gene_type:complete
MMMNPHDLSELLYRLGYYVDDETGEVMIELDSDGPPLIDKFLTQLAIQGQLMVKRNHLAELGFYLPNWTCFNSMEEYCKVFPYEQQCKEYD